MSKRHVSCALLLLSSLVLAGCAETAGDKTVQQYGWRVEMMETANLCADFKDATAKANKPIQRTILKELQSRRAVSRLTTIDSITSAPPLKTTEAEVQCLWPVPDSQAKRVAADGVTETVYVYENIERKDEASSALYDEILVFRNGRLFSVDRIRL